jgi:hypothetical protein
MRQQHSQFAVERLHMYRTVKPCPHHLRDAARIIAIRLVDLRLQHRLHVPRLDTDRWQACFRQCTEQPLRQRPGLQPDPLKVVGRVTQYPQQIFRFARPFTSRTILPASSTMQTLVSLTDTSNPAKWSMLRFSF